jgi:hypothetical protein
MEDVIARSCVAINDDLEDEKNMDTITTWVVWTTFGLGAANALLYAVQLVAGDASRSQMTRSMGSAIGFLLYAVFTHFGSHIPAMIASGGTLFLILWTLTFGNAVEDATEKVPERIRDDADPIMIAEKEAPELLEAVRTAVNRMEAFRRIANDATDSEAVTVSVMIRERIPSMMDRYRATSGSATDEERRDLATTALMAVIDVGEASERLRAAAVANRRDAMSTEGAFIANRLGVGRDAMLSSID